MKHTISVLVENEFGVLARVAGLFSGRGFNIESLSVAETVDPRYSRITLTSNGSAQIIEQILKQLNKLICVVKVTDLTAKNHVEREMVLVKIVPDAEQRAEVLRVVDIFRARVVDVSRESYILMVTGDDGKIKAFLEILKPLGLKEIVRTGKVAMGRGAG